MNSTVQATTLSGAESIRWDLTDLFVSPTDPALDDRLHFSTWVSSRNLANETSDEAVQALVDAVSGRYEICVRYYRVKKRLLNAGLGPVTTPPGRSASRTSLC